MVLGLDSGLGLGLGLGWRGGVGLAITTLDKKAGMPLSPAECILAETIVPPPRALLYQRHETTKTELNGRMGLGSGWRGRVGSTVTL